jgi:diadenosine tetraphosphate (Ap4A) HIT family hydrolase
MTATGNPAAAGTSPFLDSDRWINQNETAAALRDGFPVSLGHTLIVPKRAVESAFDLSEQEILDCWRLVSAEARRLREEFSPTGFNVGINVGATAGQTVNHAHIHLIPRYAGDHPSPRGGVRAVIPGKANY